MTILRPSLFAPPIRFLQPGFTKLRCFHETAAWRTGNFYQILGLEAGASADSIKKRFYSLSKTHHPDRNPKDPQASERFVKISEAYATIGNPQKRERYDRDVIGVRDAASHPTTPRGSHSSASTTPFGSRPASGLSRRRTQFKGPPPSFYRNGGWGSHGARRQSQAQGGSAASGATTGTAGGFSPGQGQSGFNNDVPHFDQEGHYRTQQSHEQRWRRRSREDSREYSTGDADMVLRFMLIVGSVSLAFVPWWAFGLMQKPKVGNAKDRIAQG